ncbi:hypothetical protein [Methanosarcina sp. 2.H.A.1B.4]|uniref:hypothetical protein n=1 Tax=Methanosarcina sp. 2.H.A.1B.4 TaxID=1483600 RepID=UPI00062243ED|nr:hypothetical protein [Methanosarcina sp. 2.H.A.1B.4]KKG08724.1 hypothetical protein EO92_12895 [Methanosarcina sp. 2.H.A.1B.4]
MGEKENSNVETGVKENIDELCLNNYELIKDEIVSAIMKGVEEGVKEGVKNGILRGLDECFEIGFLNVMNIREKKIGEIVEEVACETTKNQVKDQVKKETCPILEHRGDMICEKILNEIKEESEGIPEAELDLIRALNIKKICNDKANEIKQDVRKNLPQNFVSLVLFDGMLEAISECMTENVESCSEKIQETARQNRSV